MVIPDPGKRKSKYSIFDTKRTIFMFRLSGCTSKHFTKETREDWENVKHGDWGESPEVNMKRSNAKINVTCDRLFYYCGDTINIKIFVNLIKAKLDCKGIEVSLGRSIAVDGF